MLMLWICSTRRISGICHHSLAITVEPPQNEHRRDREVACERALALKEHTGSQVEKDFKSSSLSLFPVIKLPSFLTRKLSDMSLCSRELREKSRQLPNHKTSLSPATCAITVDSNPKAGNSKSISCWSTSRSRWRWLIFLRPKFANWARKYLHWRPHAFWWLRRPIFKQQTLKELWQWRVFAGWVGGWAPAYVNIKCNLMQWSR